MQHTGALPCRWMPLVQEEHHQLSSVQLHDVLAARLVELQCPLPLLFRL
jgi:hypothetical protein